jgi:hypothetical protein
VTKTELAELTGRSPRTVQKWIEIGWLKGRYDKRPRQNDPFRICEDNFYEFWQRHREEVPLHRWSREGLEWLLTMVGEASLSQPPMDKTKLAEEVQQMELGNHLAE